MICPFCKQKPKNNQLYGFYRGNLFIIKEFSCCGRMIPVSDYRGYLNITYDQKKDKYTPVIVPHYNRYIKFDYTRILVTTNEMGRHA